MNKLINEVTEALQEIIKWPEMVAEAFPDLTEISGWAILTLTALAVIALLRRPHK